MNELYLNKNCDGPATTSQPFKITNNVKIVDKLTDHEYTTICWVDLNGQAFMVKEKRFDWAIFENNLMKTKRKIFSDVDQIKINNLGIFVVTNNHELYQIKHQTSLKNYSKNKYWKFISNNVKKIDASDDKLFILKLI